MCDTRNNFTNYEKQKAIQRVIFFKIKAKIGWNNEIYVLERRRARLHVVVFYTKT